MALRAHRLLVPCLLMAALGLAACGGGSSAADRKAVEETLVESSTTTDPADCGRLSTRGLLEQTTKQRGAAAVRVCEEETASGETAADAVSVSEIEIDGDEATADVAIEGSSLDGQTLTMALVEDAGTWKVDEVVAFAEFDREKVILEMGRGLYEQVGAGVDARFAECVLGRLEDLADESLEAVILDPSPDPLLALARACEDSETV
jgi:hypothetical protein